MINDPIICVLCGSSWEPPYKNVCECGGFCSWGTKLGGLPDSWDINTNGYVPKPVPNIQTPIKKVVDTK